MRRVFDIINRITDDLLDIAWPEVCMGCGKRFNGGGESLICSDCLMNLSKVDYYEHDENFVTTEFFRHSVELEYGCCFLQYKKGDYTQSLMHNIKYFQHPTLGITLGQMAATEMQKHNRFMDAEYIVPIPMHPDKLKDRGFNQAERIARGFADVYRIPLCEDALAKTVNSKTQAFMSPAERIENAKRLFAAHYNEDLDGKHILIVDDVFTTGSTLIVCAQKLHEAMPKSKISVFALAKA